MDIRPIGNGALSGSTTSPAPVSNTESNSSAGTSVNGATDSTSVEVGALKNTHAEPSAAQLSDAVKKINNALTSQAQGIEFSIDSNSSSHQVIVKVVDQSTNEVIRQIPSKEALAIADSLGNSLDQSQTQGLLIKLHA